MADKGKSAGPTTRAPFRVYEPREGTTRWVQPIEELPFKVELRYLSDEEQAEIFDKHKVYPNSQHNTMKKLNRIAGDMIAAKVVAWEHPDSIFRDVPKDFPCEGLNKQRLQNVFFKRDGDDAPTTLWRLIVTAEEEALEAETKN